MLKHAIDLALLGLLSVGAAACAQTVAVERVPVGGHRVLFVGNSLTYVNDLPSTVAAIAAAAGDTFHVAIAAGANLALIDHLNGATDAVERIKRARWDFVVLQQGPTTTGACRDSLILWTEMFAPMIRAAGAEPALFMTWPAPTSPGSLDDVRTSFDNAAGAVHGIFLPAGEAWRAALVADPSLELREADGFHPSPVGTFLAALEIYERLSGRDARTLPALAFAGAAPFLISPATIQLLQRSAHDANARYPSHPPAPPQTQPSPSPPGGHC